MILVARCTIPSIHMVLMVVILLHVYQSHHLSDGYSLLPQYHHPIRTTSTTTISTIILYATSKQMDDGKKKRRVRKTPPAVPKQDPIKVSQPSIEGTTTSIISDSSSSSSSTNNNNIDNMDMDDNDNDIAIKATLDDIVRFEFQNQSSRSYFESP